MKKITLSLFLALAINISFFAQTSSTGTINLSSTSGLEYTAKIDITSTNVTLTLVGPSDRWLALGFGASSMTTNKDVVIFNGTNLTDRTFQGIGSTPTLDNNQDWSISSNTILSGVRTLIATRNLNTGETNDYVFTTSDTSISLVWARGNGATFNLSNHGGGNRGATASGITLGINDLTLANNFKIYPNPASSKINIKLPSTLNTVTLEAFNTLGSKIYNQDISNLNTSIDVSNWSNGIYLIHLKTDNNLLTKRFIKQ